MADQETMLTDAEDNTDAVDVAANDQTTDDSKPEDQAQAQAETMFDGQGSEDDAAAKAEEANAEADQEQDAKADTNSDEKQDAPEDYDNTDALKGNLATILMQAKKWKPAYAVLKQLEKRGEKLKPDFRALVQQALSKFTVSKN